MLKRMRTILRAIGIVLVCTGFAGLVSCTEKEGGDESGGQGSGGQEQPGTGGNDLSEAARQFVGLWISQNTTRPTDYLFKEDGMCRTSNSLIHQSYPSLGYDAYWSYNEKTGVLATSVDEASWEINLSNGQAWSGTLLSGKPKAESFRKGSNLDYILASLMKTFWKNAQEGKTLHFYYKINGERAFQCERNNWQPISTLLADIDVGKYDWPCIMLSEDDNADDYTIKYEIGLLDYNLDKMRCEIVRNSINGRPITQGSGTLTLINPHSTTACKLVLTGKYELTMAYDAEAEAEAKKVDFW